MKNKYLKFLFPIALILALTVSMIGTRSVLADDAPPTPTDEVPTETPPVEESSETQETLEQTVPEILEQLPAETEIVVLDENSEPLPLVSNEAANVLVTGDPQWCPAGVTPGTDTLGQCTVAHTSFNDLINDLQTNSATYYGSGTIYVAYDYAANTAGDSSNDIIFDYGALDLTDLVVQGGWDFTQDKVVGTSTIDLKPGYSLEFWDWGGYGTPATLTLKNLFITNSDGLFIGDDSDVTTADITLENVEVDSTEFGTYIETDGDIEITNSKFNNTANDNGLTIYSYGGDVTLEQVLARQNDGDGAYIEADGDITIKNSVFDNNDLSGAYIDTSCGCGTGNVFVQSSTFIENNDRGLVVYAIGDITVDSIDAELNEVGGVELDNCGIFGGSPCFNTNLVSITMTGTNTIKNNGGTPGSWFIGPASVGLWVTAADNISISGTTVTGNGAGDIGGGAFVLAGNGNISISNSTFDDNCTTYQCDMGFGLFTLNDVGTVTIKNVTADGNGNGDGSTYNSDTGNGVLIISNGNIFVENSVFNGNCNTGTCSIGAGIQVATPGNVYFNFVTASNNGTMLGGGANITVGGNVDVYCSFFANEAVGLAVDIPTGSVLTMRGVSFSGNTTDFVPPSSGGTWTSDPNCPVNAFSGGGKGNTNLPLRIVNVGSGNGIDLDCQNYSGTKLVLENGDNLVVPCPLGGSASLTKQDANGLPSSLPSGSTFRSGIVSVVTESGSVDGKLSQPVLVSFIMPEGVDASALAILYWDGSQWTEVNGTFVLTENGKTYFAAFVNYTGTFVLVQR
ncbi:MAG TPA: right-handed parallel beta-helix repeat-containing protein [Anaerolineales bacterium]|nr:right-handed parallel beta-helix repeat-containing protein [Anaerolineales bacterium]